MSKTRRNNVTEDNLRPAQPYKRRRYQLSSFEADYIRRNEDPAIYL